MKNLREKFPNASASFLAVNSNGLQSAKPQSDAQHALDKVAKRKEKSSQSSLGRDRRIAISYTIKRVRLQDEDNAMGGTKAITDSLKLAGLIPDDNPEAVSITVQQEKVKSFADEKLEIEISYP